MSYTTRFDQVGRDDVNVAGGKGANQAVAAARLGAHVRMVGAVGKDPFAEEALKGIDEARIDHDLMHADDPTGVALIFVDARGETEIVVAPGANAASTAAGRRAAIDPMRAISANALEEAGLYLRALARHAPAQALLDVRYRIRGG